MIRFLLVRYFVSGFLAKRTRSQAAIGVVLPVLGVAIGVFAFIVVLSVMGGFVAGLKGRLLALEPHIEVIRADGFGNLPASEELLAALGKLSSEIEGASPFLKGDAIVQSGTRPASVVLLGIDPARAASAAGLRKFLRSGAGLEEVLGQEQEVLGVLPKAAFPPILLGEDLARTLGADVGDRLTLMSTVPEEGPGGMAPLQLPAAVSDLISTGSSAVDAKWVVVPLALAQTFFDAAGEWSGVQLRVKEPLDVDALIPGIDAALKERKLRAKPWTESNRALLRALQLERWGMSFVIGVIIVVGCFSITITLILAVKRKAREMAILRSLGLTRVELGGLLLAKGALIGAVGVALGLSFGLVTLRILSTVPLPILSQAYSGRTLPVLIDWGTVAQVCFGTMALSMLAALWPSGQVMRIDVVETLADRG